MLKCDYCGEEIPKDEEEFCEVREIPAYGGITLEANKCKWCCDVR